MDNQKKDEAVRNISLHSLNVRGLRDANKRNKILHFMKEKYPGILFLQETHTVVTDEPMYHQLYGENVFFSHGTNTSKGTMTIIPKCIKCEIKEVKVDDNGRYVLIKGVFNEKTLTLLNIYAPTQDKQTQQIELLDKLEVVQMARRRRPGLSAPQKQELWERWKCGQSMNDIARAFGKERGSIRSILRSTGGFKPSTRRRSCLALSLSEREEISRGLAEGQSMRTIASLIQRAPSTVSREIGRHHGRARYRAAAADRRAWNSGLRPKRCRLAIHRRLQKIVAEKLSLNWSPEQISGWLKWQYLDDTEMRISHETIYRSLFIQAREIGRAHV
jgi:predicted transcriptional regulator with HTH domain